MNTSGKQTFHGGSALTAVALAALITAGCASAPVAPTGAAEARIKLSSLQADPNLANRAPVAIREAEEAVRLAEQPVADKELGAHRVYLADRKVEIARARAATRYAEDQRASMGEARELARLKARTLEADKARADADSARAETDALRVEAAGAASDAAAEAAELQAQIDAMQAEVTDRGVVLTLGDVLFATGKSDLRAGATGNLNKLVTFLNRYPTRNVQIEGHTDSVGSAAYNQGLSERRAEAVRSYLVRQGISSQRLVASGLGLNQPVADNSTDYGRQQNRRVVVIIDNPMVVARP